MKIISQVTDFLIKEETAVAIGKFDGCHRGHQKIIKVLTEAKREGLQTAIFSFDPPPNIFFGRNMQGELFTKEEKRVKFAELGVDILIEYPLNEETSRMSPTDFIGQVLKKQVNAKKIAAGEDISFGYRGEGNRQLLESYAQELSYEAIILSKEKVGEREISSSYIKEEIAKGNMSSATSLLGTPYSVSGTVVYGNQLGRTLGMPTANLKIPDEKLLPPRGVYRSKVYLDGNVVYDGITNIGCKPTVSETRVMGAETYLYDFAGDLYGKQMTVELLEFHRPEMKFVNVESLREQMERDMILINQVREMDG